jgi:hypothetical protein
MIERRPMRFDVGQIARSRHAGKVQFSRTPARALDFGQAIMDAMSIWHGKILFRALPKNFLPRRIRLVLTKLSNEHAG